VDQVADERLAVGKRRKEAVEVSAFLAGAAEDAGKIAPRAYRAARRGEIKPSAAIWAAETSFGPAAEA
jgi:hypothetical protein